MLDFLKKIFGTAQSRILKKYEKIVLQVNRYEEQLQALSEEDLRQKTTEFRARIASGETLEQILPEAYAVVKNMCRRLCGVEVHVSGYDQKWDMVPYDVQILGAIAMHYGAIAEMQTGEGKTLTAAMPLYLNALTGKPVHLVTVNDYLANRDCQWIGTIFRRLGLTVESLTNATPHQARRAVYASDIVYGTSSEFGFDYLRDNSMAQSRQEQCQRGHFFAIVDEIDSILIDEARTPLIISGPASTSRQLYDVLKDDVSYVVRLQRDLCNRLATEARKTFEKLGRLDSTEPKKLSKEEEAEEKEAFRKLWLVGKGTPQNKILKRIKEDPDLRAQIEKWDIYYYAEPNKEEKAEALSELYIIIDERSNEFELTDKGIQAWTEAVQDPARVSDFTMLDLSHEYLKVDENTELNEEEKLAQKVLLREEDSKRKERSHNLRQLFRAHLLMEKDVDYIVSEDKIVIIDENTGRPQPGRRFSDGLHQAIEAKEGLAIQGETQTYATITLQNYFRMYNKLAGMTGTAITEANEFKEIYKLEVLVIPSHRPCQRIDADDQIYMSEREKYHAIIKSIEEIHSQGRPILIGTESVDVSEKLSRILKQNKLEHTVLNAKNNVSEAAIIAAAGKRGAITVATNMAGRGTDIKLEKGVAELGGLHVLITSRGQSRRIDGQFRGRSGRQGDPGSSQFYVSFEDYLMRLFTSKGITTFLQRYRPPENEAISAKMLNKAIETAQKRVEQRNYAIRKHTLEYDDVMNRQRTEIYSFRNEVLGVDDPLRLARDILESVCLQESRRHFATGGGQEKWDPQGYREWLFANFPVSLDTDAFENDYAQLEEIEGLAIEKVVRAFDMKMETEAAKIRKAQELFGNPTAALKPPEAILKEVVRGLLIRHIDSLWQEHLLHIDHLRTEVSLRTVAQKDPLLEFKHEAFELFDNLSFRMKLEIGHALFKFEMVVPQPQPPPKTVTIEAPPPPPPKPEEPPAAPPRLFHRTNLSLLPEV